MRAPPKGVIFSREYVGIMVSDLLREKIETLKQEKLGLKRAKIFEADFSLLMSSSEERFDKFNIEHDEIISSNVKEGTISPDYGDSEGVGGKTTFYSLNGEIHSAVFMPECDRNESAELIKQYIVLLHELGHVSDMENGINFGHPDDEVNAIKAEGYAEVFALKHLDRNKSDLVDVMVKGLYANALLERAKTNDFYKKVHLEITKYFREKRLKGWSKKI